MTRKWLAGIGAAIFVVALLLGAYLLLTNWLAQSRDGHERKHGVIVSDFPPCIWDVGMAQRVLSENNSQTIVVNTENLIDVECQSELTLLAPGFDVSPRKETLLLKAQPKSSGSIAWIVAPKSTGSYDLAISDGIDTRTVGVTVTNTLGLTATQSQVLAFLGSLFGPMLTVPWWFERWQQRKRSRAQTSPVSAPATATPPEPPAK